MRSETAITLALLALHHDRHSHEVGTRGDVLAALARLRDTCSHRTDLRLRPSPTGLRSEEVSRFLGRLAMSGYMIQESPIRLTDPGLTLLRSHAASVANEPDVMEAMRVLGLPSIDERAADTDREAD